LRVRFRHLAALLSVALVASAAQAASQADLDAAMSHDGLKRITVKGLSLAYARPGATLAGYKRVKIDPVEVAFHKDWNPTRPGSRIPISSQTREEIRTELAKLVQAQFVKALEEKGRYPVVNASGPDVLRARIYIVNLIVNAPGGGSSSVSSRTFVMSAGEMTLFLDLYDSETGQILARAVDRREARSNGVARMASRVTNIGEAEDIAAAWARILRDALDRAHGAAKK
jgi:hypothetical protein